MYGVEVKKYIVAGCLLGLLSSSALVSAQNHNAGFITFNVANSAYTSPIAINNDLTVMGVYADAQNTYHGFIRSVWGRIVSFDPPGSTYTSPSGLNDEGVITGFFNDAAGTHGFLRSPEGKFTSFNVPGSPATMPVGINDSDTIAGYYDDPNYSTNHLLHGFVRSKDGVITSFDAGPAGGSTITAGINNSGIVIGRVQAQIIPGELSIYGFQRSPQGTITTLSLEEPFGINAEGTIVGTGGLGYPAVIISPEGTITTFQVPGTYTTVPATINGQGTIAGQYFVTEGNNDTHGFVRTPEGTITSFDPPGSTRTDVSAINDYGLIAGETLHANNVVYGFLRIPEDCGWLLDYLSEGGPR